ncbi:MAG: hypothetical protein HY721_04695 [Planctomycetes bacterium]|nr:hypothetical protein [Planctomycetota bacterium]
MYGTYRKGPHLSRLAVTLGLAAQALGGEGPEGLGPREIVLTAPLPAPRASFFHAALEVPALEPARTLGPGDFLVRVETSHARSVDTRRVDGFDQHFDGLFHEWGVLRLAAGVLPGLELQARAGLAGWDEELDTFFILDRAGNPIVHDEEGVVLKTGASGRHDNLSDVVLGAKGLLLARERFGLDVAIAGAVKLPAARHDDLSHAGTTDLAFSLLASLPLGRVTLHASSGVGIPLGGQQIFVDAAHVDLEPFYHGGLAANWCLVDGLALVAQLEGNTSAFGDVEMLEDGPLTAFAGLRWMLGGFFLEAGGGTGLLPRSSCDYALSFALGYVFGE